MGGPALDQDRATGAHLELRVTVAFAAGEADLRIDGAPADSVGQLADAIAEHLGDGARAGLWCERRSQALAPATKLADAGIRWGDRLRLAPPVDEPSHAGGTPVAELEVTGGPCAGQRWELGAGSFQVGRDRDCDVFLLDPSLSRRHLKLEIGAGRLSVADAGSSNGTAIDGRRLMPGAWETVGEEDELELGRTMIRLRTLAPAAAGAPRLPERGGRLEFNRSPRVNPTVEPFTRELAAPPSRGRKLRLPLAASLAPVGAGVLLFVLLKSPVMLAIAGLSPVMAMSSWLSDRRGGKKSYARGSADFRAHVKQAVAALDAALKAEALERRAESPDTASLVERARSLAPSLWERRPGDADFLRLRVGAADLPARAAVAIKDGGEQELRDEADSELAGRLTVPAVPLTIDLALVRIAGLSGAPRAVGGLARSLVIQAATLHSPGDLVVLAAVGEANADDWSWLKWLPHLRPDRLAVQAPPIAVGRRATEELLGEVRQLVSRRGERRPGPEPDRPAHLLLLIDEAADPDRALVSAALTHAAGRGVSAIWLGRDRRDLPGQCGAIVEVASDRAVLALTDVETGNVTANASADGLPLDVAGGAARLLAPVRDVSELARAGEIPRGVSLLELLDLLPPRPAALEARWRSWRGDLRSIVGRSGDGPFTIDLRADGPHALIAGTTGSGKSELLRTFVAAAAANAPPNRLSFLLIDYKGGSAFAPCASLPHVVDVVSDLDEHLAERALVSLNAELKRRELVLARTGAKDLLELQRKDPDAAPPLLVIAVDEFAKLRDEVPDFVDGVVDIAQRGRSLGVHMVLAAQTLRNAFTPAIRANTNLRIALRVAEETESEDMIGSPVAARIPSGERFRGRAFARTGHAELREFQAAYVSGRTPTWSERRISVADFALEDADMSPAAGPAGDSDDDNDLTALGAAATAAQESMGLRMPAPPWLAMLPTVLDRSLVSVAAAAPGRVAIGLVDLPGAQRQDPLVLDLPQVGHVAVFGGGGSGKSTVLTTAALALAGTAPPGSLVIYGIDAGSGSLAALEPLPHCGGIVRVSEEERINRLFRMLLARVERRAPAAGAQPMIVVLLDDLGVFANEYDRPGFGTPFESLGRVLASGRASGVHVILTAARRGALSSALAAHIGQRLALRMPTEEDLLSLGLDAKTVRGARLPVGRGFTQESREFQVAVGVRDGAIAPVAELAAEVAGEPVGAALRIELLPSSVTRASLRPSSVPGALTLGIADADLGTATVDLTDMHLLVVGSFRSGRSTLLSTLARGIREAVADAELHLLAPRRTSPLRGLEIWTSAALSAPACKESVVGLVARVEAGEFDQRPAFLFVDDGGELTEAMIVTQLDLLVRRARDTALRVVAAVDTGGARGVGLGWVRELRREGHGVLLQPDLTSDGDILSARLPRRVPVELGPGRGFLVSRGVASLVQVAS